MNRPNSLTSYVNCIVTAPVARYTPPHPTPIPTPRDLLLDNLITVWNRTNKWG